VIVTVAGSPIGGVVVGVDGTVYQSVGLSGAGPQAAVIVIDPSDPTNPQTVLIQNGTPIYEGLVAGTDGLVYQTTIVETAMDVYTTYVTTIDTSDLANVQVAAIEGRPAGGVVVATDGTVYQVTKNSEGEGETYIAVIYPSDPTVAHIATVIGTPIRGLVIGANGTAYVTTQTNLEDATTLHVAMINPTDPTNPQVVDVSGNYVLNYADGNPFSGMPQGVVFGTDGTVYQVAADDTTDTTNIAVIDPSDPTNPQIVSLPGGLARGGLAVGPDGTVYQTTVGFDGMDTYSIHISRIDPADPLNPQIQTFPYAGAVPYQGIVVADDGTAYQTLSVEYSQPRTTWATYVMVFPPTDFANPTTVTIPGGSTLTFATVAPDGLAYQSTFGITGGHWWGGRHHHRSKQPD
jgi:hypothetical protein